MNRETLALMAGYSMLDAHNAVDWLRITFDYGETVAETVMEDILVEAELNSCGEETE